MSDFRSEKALHVLFYVSHRLKKVGNLYWVLKAIYFADKRHLKMYGRQIYQQSHMKLEAGNVPSYAYDIATHVRDGKPQSRMPKNVKKRLRVGQDDTIEALESPDMGFFSESELECLDKSIEAVKDLSFNELRRRSHKDPLFIASKMNTHINLEETVKSLPNSRKLLEYINDPHPG